MWHLGDAAMHCLLPEKLPGALVETVDLPGARLSVGDFVARAVDAETWCQLFARFTNGCRDKELVAPDDGTRMAKALGRNLPLDVLAGRDVPFRRQRVAVRDTGGLGPAVLGPVAIRRLSGKGAEEEGDLGENECYSAHGVDHNTPPGSSAYA